MNYWSVNGAGFGIRCRFLVLCCKRGQSNNRGPINSVVCLQGHPLQSMMARDLSKMRCLGQRAEKCNEKRVSHRRAATSSSTDHCSANCDRQTQWWGPKLPLLWFASQCPPPAGRMMQSEREMRQKGPGPRWWVRVGEGAQRGTWARTLAILPC